MANQPEERFRPAQPVSRQRQTILPPPAVTNLMPQVEAESAQPLPSRVQRSSKPPAPPRKKEPFLHPIAIFFLFLSFWVAALPFIAGYMYERSYDGRIFMGVSAMGVNLDGMTREQAAAALMNVYEQSAHAPLVIHWKSNDGTTKDWTATPADLGLQFNVQEAVDQAYTIGRGKGTVGNWRERLSAMRLGDDRIVPVFSYDVSQQSTLVTNIAGEVNRPAANASLKVLPNVSVQLIPSQVGRQVDVQATLVNFERKLAESNEAIPVVRELDLVVNEVQPAISDADLQAAKSDAEKIMSAPIVLQFQNQNWTLDRGNLATIISFREERPAGSPKPQVKVALNQDLLNNWVTNIARSVNRGPRDARINWNNGRPAVIQGYGSQTGYTVDVPAAIKAINDAVRGDARTIALNVIVSQPAVDASKIPQMGLKEVVATAQTGYSGGIPERAKNVRLAAQRLNGVVVPPGGVFSFNRELGPVTKEAGYEMGFAIIGPDTVPDVGGGVCQVATTLFQSAFWGGYEVVERFPHPYSIARYEQPPSGRPGLDAAVSDYLDLKWKNTSEFYVLVQTRDDQAAQVIHFDLISTKPGWTVSIEGPTVSNVVKADPTLINQTTDQMQKGRSVQVETARDGYDVTITRTVKRGNDVVSTQTFVSKYRPQRNVILTGTG